MEKIKTKSRQGAPMGNKNAMKHGLFAAERRLANEKDAIFYQVAKKAIRMLR